MACTDEGAATLLADPQTATRVGVACLRGFECTSTDVRLLVEWEHWKAAAIAASALNSDVHGDEPEVTYSDIEQCYRTYFVIPSPLSCPQYELTRSAMKFALRQCMHALERARDNTCEWSVFVERVADSVCIEC